MSKLKINRRKTKDGDFYYSIAASVRDGSKVSTRNFINLGRRSDIAKEHPDVDAYLQARLDEAVASGLFSRETVTFHRTQGRRIKPGDVVPYRAGVVIAKRIFDSVGLGECLDQVAEKHKFTYDLKEIVLFLLAQRLISPDSKRGMFDEGAKMNIITPSFSLHQIYRAMDVLVESKTFILKWLYDHRPAGVDRDCCILYFDGTNTYMETESERGLIARGKGKRNEHEPLVSFGLLMDGSGFPLSYVTFKGSDQETKQLIPLEETIINDFRNSDFVTITDAGLSSKEIRSFNSLSNRNFITVVPVRRMGEDKLKDYVFDERSPWESPDKAFGTPKAIWEEYGRLTKGLEAAGGPSEEEAIRERIRHLTGITLYRRYEVKRDKKPKKYRAGKEDEWIEESFIVSFSLNYALRDARQRKLLVDKATKLMAKPGSLRARSSQDPRSLIAETASTKDGELAAEKSYSLNEGLIERQARLDGYYCVSTSLSEEREDVVIRWMKYRWFIEDSFLVMKQQLAFRPINHSTDGRIDGHFFTVFLTLLIYRYIQSICHNSGKESLKGISDDDLFDLLRRYNVTKRCGYYEPDFDIDQRIIDLESVFNVFLSQEIMTKSELNKQINKKFRT